MSNSVDGQVKIFKKVISINGVYRNIKASELLGRLENPVHKLVLVPKLRGTKQTDPVALNAVDSAPVFKSESTQMCFWKNKQAKEGTSFKDLLNQYEEKNVVFDIQALISLFYHRRTILGDDLVVGIWRIKNNEYWSIFFWDRYCGINPINKEIMHQKSTIFVGSPKV